MSQTHTTAERPVCVQGYDVERLGANFGGAVRIYVHGYWSEPVSVYVERPFGGSTWRASISHSSGGRDMAQVPSDAVAARNLAAGLMQAAALMETLADKGAELEAAYQRRAAEDAAQREEQRKAREAALAADPAAAASEVVDAMRAAAQAVKADGKSRSVTGRIRADQRTVTFFCVLQAGRLLPQWRSGHAGGVRMSFDQAAAALGACAAGSLRVSA